MCYRYLSSYFDIPELNTETQQREAAVQGRRLSPMPASVWNNSFLLINE
ncbi:MAG: hypothetical protein LBJ00_14465 [Planctomycetaceae bacterium]|nr:hypothetical protein [Planctomycetaceae bacterium]